MCVCVWPREWMDGTYVCSISSHIIEPKKRNVTTDKCLRVHVRTRVYLILFAHLSSCTACPAKKYFAGEFYEKFVTSLGEDKSNRE